MRVNDSCCFFVFLCIFSNVHYIVQFSLFVQLSTLSIVCSLFQQVFFFLHMLIDGTAILVSVMSLEPVLCGHASGVEYGGIISASVPSEKQPG